MTWINVALIACVVAALSVGFYLVWFIAHPRSPEQQQETDNGAGNQGPEDPGGGRREEDPAGGPR
jgi:hypothetical protein